MINVNFMVTKQKCLNTTVLNKTHHPMSGDVEVIHRVEYSRVGGKSYFSSRNLVLSCREINLQHSRETRMEQCWIGGITCFTMPEQTPPSYLQPWGYGGDHSLTHSFHIFK